MLFRVNGRPTGTVIVRPAFLGDGATLCPPNTCAVAGRRTRSRGKKSK